MTKDKSLERLVRLGRELHREGYRGHVKTARALPEAQLQAASAKYLVLALPKTCVAIHCPSEGRRSWAFGKRLKAAGAVAGVPDWLLFAAGRAYAIELKSAKGSLSAAQQAFHERLRGASVPVAVCRSLDEIEASLKDWGILPIKPVPPKAHAGIDWGEAERRKP
jgi:hypothetical protein